jgi:hypothetical protein
MLVIRDGVDRDGHIGKLGSEGFKLPIHENVVQFESTLHINALDLFDFGKNGIALLILQHLGGSKLDVARYRHEKRYFVYEHDIPAQSEMFIVSQYIGRSTSRTFTAAVALLTVLPFSEPMSGPKMSSVMAMSHHVTGQFIIIITQ